jgi:hypothetical protein
MGGSLPEKARTCKTNGAHEVSAHDESRPIMAGMKSQRIYRWLREAPLRRV